jgi:hypothetical protein
MCDLSTRIQCDEIWSFTYAKQKSVATAKRRDLAVGETWRGIEVARLIENAEMRAMVQQRVAALALPQSN